MRVGINAWHYLPGTLGGGETYLRALVAAMARHTQDLDLVLLTTPYNTGALADLGVECIETPIQAQSRPRRIFAEQTKLDAIGRQVGLDLLHTTGNVAPMRHTLPTVLTVHDTIFLHRNHVPMPRMQQLFYRIAVPASIRRSDHVITVSHFTKSEIVQSLNIAADHVTVVHEAAGEDFSPSWKERGTLPPFLSEGKGYILYVGVGARHKNLPTLIEAFAGLAKARSEDLVIAGDMQGQHGALQRLIDQKHLSHRIHVAGRVTTETLRTLYASASVFVFPSLYEGFGLPVLEAMASGVPVIASRRGSLPEVCGDAALLIDPLDTGQVATAIERLLEDSSFHSCLSRKGLQRASKFSWTRTAAETIAVYERVLAGPPPKNRMRT